MVDFLVIGSGLAGISFCEVLEKNGNTFTVVSDDSQTASKVAGGLYNPVILKRFTPVWRAQQQLDIAMSFYSALEDKLKTQFDYKTTVLRRFASVEEQNLWFENADKPLLTPFLNTKLLSNRNKQIYAPFGYGMVNGTGRVTTKLLLERYKTYAKENGYWVEERFQHAKLSHFANGIKYGAIEAKHIVFAEGYGLKQNPYFNYLPLNGTKGELLTIVAPKLKADDVLKSSVFSIPLGKDKYRIGATYHRFDKTNIPTQQAREELTEKLERFIKCPYEIIDHVAGVRPTVADRKPLVGRHPKYKNMYVLNGFGSRGVMIAPFAAKILFNAIIKGMTVPHEMNCDRYWNKYLTTA